MNTAQFHQAVEQVWQQIEEKFMTKDYQSILKSKERSAP
ncbi:hypothetical protein DIBJMFBN_00729 [Mannheimia haemolytica]